MQVQTHHGLGLEVGAKRPLHLLQHICYQRKHPRCIQDGERFHHVFQRELIDQILLEVLELFLGQITAEAALDLIQSALVMMSSTATTGKSAGPSSMVDAANNTLQVSQWPF